MASACNDYYTPSGLSSGGVFHVKNYQILISKSVMLHLIIGDLSMTWYPYKPRHKTSEISKSALFALKREISVVILSFYCLRDQIPRACLLPLKKTALVDRKITPFITKAPAFSADTFSNIRIIIGIY